ncbi:uncharacterized protein [Solanum lycopersicum]|uniref:uncharacterized protein n=1 Tax=Solanum lycopersicum TaxID=4081 RepID=UPI0037494470
MPIEGRSHNKAMYITVICLEKVVNHVLVDDGSGLNIFPLSTLRQIKFDLGKLEQNQVNVRAFDGVLRDTLALVNLTIQMAPEEFGMQFQLLVILTFLIVSVYDYSNISYRPANVISCHELNEQNEAGDDKVDDYDEESEEPNYVAEEFRQLENQQKPNLEETETVNLGDSECVKEQKAQKFKTELSLKIKEDITKKIESRLVEVTEYPTWLANVVPVAKKDRKIRIFVNYRYLNKASPKDNLPLSNIHILIDNYGRHEIHLFETVTQAITKF